MKNIATISACLLAGCIISKGATFQDAAKHLDTDGALLGYINFEGDGAEIGTQLNAIYTDALATIPDMMPIPIDFPTLFDTLGFGTIEAMGISSKEVESGVYANRSVMLINGDLTGLFALYGNRSSPTTSFKAAEMAPADASGAISGQIHLTAIRDTARALMTQVMGPMGQGMVEQQLQFMVPGTDITVGEIVVALSGNWDFFWLESYDDSFMPNYKLWLEKDGAAALIERLKPLAEDESLGIKIQETDKGLLANMSAAGFPEGMGLFIETDRSKNTVRIYTHTDWGPDSDGPRLNTTEKYKSLAGRLPKRALLYSYSAGYDISALLAGLKAAPETAAYASLAEKAAALIIGDFLEPAISATYFDENALKMENYASYSTKQAVMIFPAAVGGGLAAAMAIPAFQKVRETSQEKTVMNNLRQIASAADQYFLEEGKTEVKIEDLIGPDKYIRSLEPVAGESYEGIIIKTSDKEISVTLGSGEVISIDF
ncbi:MAG: hypothetical protein ACPGSB_06590 [Opitutales bacterium]